MEFHIKYKQLHIITLHPLSSACHALRSLSASLLNPDWGQRHGRAQPSHLRTETVRQRESEYFLMKDKMEDSHHLDTGPE